MRVYFCKGTFDCFGEIDGDEEAFHWQCRINPAS
jgi:hypothetical protein